MDNVESFYPLSPLQEGMLFHTLASPGSAVYFQQMNCVLHGSFDAVAWRQAWQSLLDVHPILRTSFVWEKVDRPVQVVHRRVTMPIDEQDWRGWTQEEQDAKAEEYLREDRLRGFVISKQPLMRMALFRLADDRHLWIWSHHHLLLDGWSVQLLADKLFHLYDGYHRGELPQVTSGRPYKDYISWLVRKDLAPAEQFWRNALKGFKRANTIAGTRGVGLTEGDGDEHAEVATGLALEETEQLQTAIRQRQLTLSALVQAAWAIVLQRLSGDNDVVFGMTVSGRPPELDAIETMLGLFINAQPARVRVEPGQRVNAWLHEIQAQSLAAQTYQHAPLQSVQSWSELEPGSPLFESLVVLKNYPLRRADDVAQDSLRIENIRNFERTNYPLCLVVASGERVEVQLTYNRTRVTAETADTVLADFVQTLLALKEEDDCLVGELLSRFSGRFRLSPQQRDLLQYTEQLQKPAIRVVTAVSLARPLQASMLARACGRVAQRHEILRIRCEQLPEMRIPLQVLGSSTQLQVKVADQTWCSDAEWRDLLITLAEREAASKVEGMSGCCTVTIVPGALQAGMIVSLPAIYGDIQTAYNLVEEIVREYGGRDAGDEPLPPFEYSTYSEWQNTFLYSESADAARQFWRPYRSIGMDATLPFSRAAAVEPFSPASTAVFQLEEGVVAELNQIAGRFGTSSEVFLLSCWALLLSKVRRTSELTVYSVFDCRDDRKLEQGIGLFERYLPMTFHYEAGIPFDNWLRDVDLQARDCYEAQSAFAFDFVEQMANGGQVAAGIQNQCSFRFVHDVERTRRSGFEWEVVWEKPTTYEFGCEVICSLRGGKLQMALRYDAARIAAADATRLVQALKTVLLRAMADPFSSITQIDISDETERRQTLLSSNPAPLLFSSSAVIPRLLRTHEAVPGSDAIVSGLEWLTSEQVHARSNQLAHHLIARGVGPDKAVGICLERSSNLVIAMLAVLKAGGAYVPLDPAYPIERLRYMLEDALPSVIITESRFRDQLAIADQRLFSLDDPDAWRDASEDDLHTTISPDNLAYILYTSGTTGRPKGAAISHRALCNHMQWMQAEFGFTASDRFLQKTSFSFDASVWEFYAPLLSGGTLVLYPPGPGYIPSEIVAAVRKHNITVLQVVPTLLRMLLDEPAFTSCESLRYVFCGGEALTPELRMQFARRLPSSELVNLYGPTETCIDASFWRCLREEDAGADVPIGYPIANNRIYVMDDELRLLPGGIPGELHIAGAGLGRGYWNRPDLTAERFLPDPYSPLGGERMYKTGDLGIWKAENAFHCYGRIDSQVKLHGFRIELGEIEAVLLEHANVRQAVVLPRQTSGGSSGLSAFVVLIDPANPLSAGALRAWLKERLPDYMLPGVFVSLAALPLLPNGKVDVHALQDAPVEEEASPAASQPRNDKEQKIEDIWKKLLRISELHIDDNFFEMGGDSILTLQVAARAADAGIRITPRQIFENPTVERLAAVAEYSSTVEKKPEEADQAGAVALTPIQHDFFEQNYPDQNHYNQSALFRSVRALDAATCRKVVDCLIQRHDAFRLRFSKTATGWSQTVIREELNPVVEMLSHVQHPELNLSSGLQTVCNRLHASLNIESGPLLRVAVIEREYGSYLFLVVHHLATDIVSWKVFLQEFVAAYEQVSEGKPIKLAVPTSSFRRWAVNLAQFGRSERLRQEEDYWTADERAWADRLPVDFREGQNSEASTGVVSTLLDARSTDLLVRELPAIYHSQVKEMIVGALAHGLSLWSGKRHLLINMEGHGRETLGEAVDLSRTVGWFTTLIPVYLNLDKTDDPRVTLKAAKEQLRAIPGNGIGHGVLRYLSGRAEIQEKLASLPKAEICVNYLGHAQIPQGIEEPWLMPAMEEAGANRHPDAHRIYVLDLQAEIVNGQLRMDWFYSRNLHRQASIEELSSRVTEALQELVRSSTLAPQVALAPSDFPNAQLNQAELDRLIAQLR